MVQNSFSSNDSKLIFFLFFSALLIRVVWLLIFNGPVNPTGDEPSYVSYANDILNNSWLSSETSSEHREPFYPIVVAFFQGLFGAGQDYINIKLILCVISALSVIIIYLISRDFFSNKIAIYASAWALLYPPYCHFNTFVLRETLEVFLFLLLVFFLLKIGKASRYYALFFSAVIYTILIHTDARFLFHLPFIILYLYITLNNLKTTIRLFLLFTVFTLVLSVPWGIRNHVVHSDKFVLICTRTLGTWGQAALNAASPLNKIKADNRPKTLEEFEQFKNETVLNEEEKTGFNNGARPAYTNLGKRFALFTEFCRFARFREGYFPYPDLRFQKKWSVGHNTQGILFEGLFYPFLLIGIYFFIKEKHKHGIVLSMIISVHILLHVIVHGRARYRLSISALVTIAAVYGLFKIIEIVKHKAIESNQMST